MKSISCAGAVLVRARRAGRPRTRPGGSTRPRPRPSAPSSSGLEAKITSAAGLVAYETTIGRLPGLPGGARELLRVRLLPAVDDEHAVRAERRQYPSQPSSPKRPTVASRKASPGVEVAGFSTTSRLRYAGLGELLERAGGSIPRSREPRAVDVEADLAVVDRRHAVVRVGVAPGRRCSSPSEAYSSNRSPSSARERRLSSIPKMTSPCGSPAVRSARLSVSSASPAWRIRSVSPLSSSNAALHLLRDRERVVRDEHDLGRRARVAPPPAAATRDGRDRADDRRGERPL